MTGQETLSQADILAIKIRPAVKMLLAAKAAGLSRNWRWYLIRKVIRPSISYTMALAAWRLVEKNPHWSLNVDKAPKRIRAFDIFQLEGS